MEIMQVMSKLNLRKEEEDTSIEEYRLINNIREKLDRLLEMTKN